MSKADEGACHSESVPLDWTVGSPGKVGDDTPTRVCILVSSHKCRGSRVSVCTRDAPLPCVCSVRPPVCCCGLVVIP